MRHDFHLDAIADLRMAVDEAATTLIGRAAKNTPLTCRFIPCDEGIQVSVSVVSPDDGALRKDSFSWRVLRTLADSVTVQISAETADGVPEDGDHANHLVQIDLIKRHHGAVAG